MVSKPQFDPQTVADNWDSLKDDENSPLLNRASQGLYTPGSVFKIVTTVSALRNMTNVYDFSVDCEGEEDFNDKVIHCFNNTGWSLITSSNISQTSGRNLSTILFAFFMLCAIPRLTSSFITNGLNNSTAISFGTPHW